MFTQPRGFGRSLTVTLIVFASALCYAQRDPGVRRGPSGGGSLLPGLMQVELAIFNERLQRAIQLEAVCDGCADETLGTNAVIERLNALSKPEKQAILDFLRSL